MCLSRVRKAAAEQAGRGRLVSPRPASRAQVGHWGDRSGCWKLLRRRSQSSVPPGRAAAVNPGAVQM